MIEQDETTVNETDGYEGEKFKAMAANLAACLRWHLTPSLQTAVPPSMTRASCINNSGMEGDIIHWQQRIVVGLLKLGFPSRGEHGE